MPPIAIDNPQELPFKDIDIKIKRGNMGFGFTISDNPNGQTIKSISDAER